MGNMLARNVVKSAFLGVAVQGLLVKDSNEQLLRQLHQAQCGDASHCLLHIGNAESRKDAEEKAKKESERLAKEEELLKAKNESAKKLSGLKKELAESEASSQEKIDTAGRTT